MAYKRRYLTNGTQWKYEYVVDATAERLIRDCGLKPEEIDTAYKLSHDYERRIKFQADVQDYVDMSISSTINLPVWGVNTTMKMRLRDSLTRWLSMHLGLGVYVLSDGSRGGQPITEVDYDTATKHKGTVFQEHDICDISGHGGSCGV